MSLETRLIALVNSIGADIKGLKTTDGSLASLTTSAKTNLVAAINEINGSLASSGVQINDAVGDGVTATTWSANKIYDTIEAAKAEVKSDLTAGASIALDTLNELAAALGNDPSFAANIATQIAARVRFDAAQVLDTTQKAQVNSNIGSASLLSTGNLERDLVADYSAAKV